MNRKVIIAANSAWYLSNFRLNLAFKLRELGYEVVFLAPPGDLSKIDKAGIRFIPVPMDNMGTNPMKDGTSFFKLFRILRVETPRVYLGYTVKPNVYGGLACQLLNIPSIHNIAGLGTSFMCKTWLRKSVSVLYYWSLRKATKVFFQNPDDLSLFLKHRLVLPSQVECLPGSGVDTCWFSPQQDYAVGPISKPFRFLLSARLLWDKGVGEYVEAARRLIAEGYEIECQLLGFCNSENRAAISREEVERWESEGIIRYLGAVDDVRPFLAQADCVVLPSYYKEGVPRSLLEAASMGKPIITTDVTGCREVVDDALTGFLCKPKDSGELAQKMREMLTLSEHSRIKMGEKGRAKMIEKFDEKIVIDRYVQAINQITNLSRNPMVNSYPR